MHRATKCQTVNTGDKGSGTIVLLSNTVTLNTERRTVFLDPQHLGYASQWNTEWNIFHVTLSVLWLQLRTIIS